MLHYASNPPNAHPLTFSLDLIAIWYRSTLTRLRSVKKGEKLFFLSSTEIFFSQSIRWCKKNLERLEKIFKNSYISSLNARKHQKHCCINFNLRKMKKIWKMRWKMFNYSDVILFIINRKIVKWKIINEEEKNVAIFYFDNDWNSCKENKPFRQKSKKSH